jgi:hypothetical protein
VQDLTCDSEGHEIVLGLRILIFKLILTVCIRLLKYCFFERDDVKQISQISFPFAVLIWAFCSKQPHRSNDRVGYFDFSPRRPTDEFCSAFKTDDSNVKKLAASL